MGSATISDTSAWEDRVRRQTAIELRPSLDAMVAECVRYVQDGMPELDHDEELAEGLYASAWDNLDRIFGMLALGTPATETHAPPGAIRYAEVMVRRGTPLATLLRAYRLGTMWFWTLWRREIIKRVEDPDQLMLAVDHSMSFVFDYVDVVSEEVTEEYARQRERWARSAAALRHETVVELLEGRAGDLDVAASRLGYDLGAGHLGLVLWAQPRSDEEDVIDQLERRAHAIAATAGARRALLVPDGRATLWAWLAFEGAPAEERLHAVAEDRRALEGIHVACGEPASGVGGFVASHREAVEVQHLAALSGRFLGRFVRYDSVVVASLLVTDAPRARRFVERELGGLAADDDATTRVRATVKVLLEEGNRTTATARRLNIHQNTVTYRVKQAERLLGHPLTERRFEVETALRLLPMLG